MINNQISRGGSSRNRSVPKWLHCSRCGCDTRNS